MKRNVVRVTLGLAVAVAALIVLESQADAKLFGGRNGGNGGGGLFNRNKGCCEQSCEPTCCPAPEPVCCEPAPVDCGCNSGCDNGGRKRLFGGRRNRNDCGCNTGCASGCGEVVVPADGAHPPAAAPADPAGGMPPAPTGAGA